MKRLKNYHKSSDLDELIEKLIFVEKVDKGLSQLDDGKTVPHEKVKEIVKKW